MMEIGRGVSIAALVVAIVSIFIPIYGLYLVIIGTVLAIASALYGERPLTIAATLVNLLNVLFLSPSLYIVLNIQRMANGNNTGLFWLVVVLLLCLPFLAIYLNANGHLRIPQAGSAQGGSGWQAPQPSAGPQARFSISTVTPNGQVVRSEVSAAKPQCVVGRSAENSDMVIPDDTVSRMHARFELRKDELWVSDLDSLNKTRLDGMLVEKEPVRVRPGARVTLGQAVTLTISSA
jgi:hypothetical protein